MVADAAPKEIASPAERAYWIRSLATSILVASAMVGAAFLARALGWRLPTYIGLPVFLTLNSVLQPPVPGAPRRSRWHRVAFTLGIAGAAGVLLWFVEVGAQESAHRAPAKLTTVGDRWPAKVAGRRPRLIVTARVGVAAAPQ